MSEVESFFLNATHAVSSSGNSVFELKLGNSISLSGGYDLALVSANFQHSNYNISAKLNNNSFQVWFPNPSTTFTVTMADSGRSIEDINAALEKEFYDRNLYLWDDVKNKPFYLLRIEMDLPRYRYVVTSYPVTTVAGSISNPKGLTLNGFAPQLIILPNNNFGKTIGFNPQSLPPAQNTPLITIWSSDFSPQIDSTSVYIVQCNWLSGSSYQNYQALAMCPIRAPFGSAFEFAQQGELQYFPCLETTFNTLKLTIVNERAEPIQFEDPQHSFFLSLRKRRK